MIRRPPRSTLFPYTTLFRSDPGGPAAYDDEGELGVWHVALERGLLVALDDPVADPLPRVDAPYAYAVLLDAGDAEVRGLRAQGQNRSEERRVGKECRSRWSPYH